VLDLSHGSQFFIFCVGNYRGCSVVHFPLSVPIAVEHFPSCPQIETLEKRLNYVFHRKAYAYEAMSMQSLAHKDSGLSPGSFGSGIPHWERMEFLGDSVIDALVTRRLYNSMPESDPGKLTTARMEVVCNDSFALVCEKLGLFDVLIKPYVFYVFYVFFALLRIECISMPEDELEPRALQCTVRIERACRLIASRNGNRLAMRP